MMNLKNMVNGIQLDAENRQAYVYSENASSVIDLPTEYADRVAEAMEIEDETERFEALSAIEDDLEADDDIWAALEAEASSRTFRVFKGTCEEVEGNTDPVALLTTRDKDEVAAYLKQVKATDESHCIEIYKEDADGEFVDGSDFDTPSNFIARIDFI